MTVSEFLTMIRISDILFAVLIVVCLGLVGGALMNFFTRRRLKKMKTTTKPLNANNTVSLALRYGAKMRTPDFSSAGSSLRFTFTVSQLTLLIEDARSNKI